MLMDAKWAIQTPATLSEDLVAGTTVAFLSEPIDLVGTGYADGGGELEVQLRSKVSTAGAADNYAVEILTGATSSPTEVAALRNFLRTDCATGKFVGSVPLPAGLKRYIKVRITGGSTPSAMTGSTTFNAGVITTG